MCCLCMCVCVRVCVCECGRARVCERARANVCIVFIHANARGWENITIYTNETDTAAIIDNETNLFAEIR